MGDRLAVRTDQGFTLVEVLIAVLLLAVAAGGVASLTAVATRAVVRARTETSAVLVATARMEQLRGLAWGFGSVYAPQAGSDTATDLSTETPGSSGAGLAASPSALDVDTAGYVDYLDIAGRWIGNTPGAPGAARFVRRWSVQPLAGLPDALILQVRVTDTRGTIPDIRLFTIKTRTAG